ncbi:MAG: type II toxin-antitoxin system CcdA family antitoxin [Parcubacteria group bacterium]
MAKTVIAVNLSDDIIAKLREVGGNRSANVERILRAELDRTPTREEIAAAIKVLARMAEEASDEPQP